MLTLPQKLARFHWLSVILMYALLTAGVILIYSATHLSDRPEIQNSVNQQLIAIAAGSVAFFALALIRYQTLIDYGPWILGVSLVSLVAVLLFGRTVYGAKSWLPLGFASIQPAEFSKLAFICAFTWFLVHFRDRINSWRVLLLAGLLAALPLSLILAQPDTGTALVFGPIIFFMLMVAGLRWIYLLPPVAGAALALFASYTIIYHGQWDGTLKDLPGAVREGFLIETGQAEKPQRFEQRAQKEAALAAEARARGENPAPPQRGKPLLKPHQLNRIKSFFNPDLDPLGSGWTIRQCLIAIGSGGKFGKGYLQGDQNTFQFLPGTIVHNDFIFSVAAEEFGFLGGSFLIASLAGLLLCLVFIATQGRDEGAQLLVAGIFGMIFAHFFQNIGMTIKVMPITGIPLPFISYGGSFIVTCMAGMGIVQSVWIHRKEY